MAPRVAVIGCGAIATRAHIPGLLAAGARITLVCSRSEARVSAARDLADGAIAVADWQDAVVADDVDAVAICTPNHLHEPVAVAAARAGKHVLVEKPMATSVASADAMIAAARDAGVVLIPAHNVRFAAPFVAAAELVRSGRLGSLTGIRAAFGHAGPERWAPEATWFRDLEAAGGGALIDLGVHVADLVRSVTGQEVVSVSAALHRDAVGIDDDAQVVFALSGGGTGSFHASWTARPGPDHQLTVFGTGGTLHLDGRTPLTLFAADGAAPERVHLPADPGDPFREFVAAIGGAVPQVTAADGRAAVAIVEAAYRSALTGTRTPVSSP